MKPIATDVDVKIDRELMTLDGEVVINVPLAIQYRDFNGIDEQVALWNLYVDAVNKLQNIPEGYASVPVEPTEAMIIAAMDAREDWYRNYDGSPAIKKFYASMLKAAQEENK